MQLQSGNQQFVNKPARSAAAGRAAGELSLDGAESWPSKEELIAWL